MNGYEKQAMACPRCGSNENIVTDSRPTQDAAVIRRKRKCICGFGFRTRETFSHAKRTTICAAICGAHTKSGRAFCAKHRARKKPAGYSETA